MVVHVSGEQVLARIGFAERWLHRAKQQCAEGNVTRGVLTLVLADAEMHHAMEVAGAPRRAGGRRGSVARALAAFTVAAGVAVAVAMPWSAPADSITFNNPAPPVVRLATPGDLLLAVSPAQPTAPVPASGPWNATVPSLPVAAAMARSSAAIAPGTIHATVERIVSQASPDSIRALPDPAGTSSGVTARVTAPLLSMGDVIDLVLAAERALRSEPISLSSP